MSELRKELSGEARCLTVEVETHHRIWETQYARYCGLCGRILYADQDTLGRIDYATQSGLDSPLRCERCGEEYDDPVSEG
jgi:hypothetical protein